MIDVFVDEGEIHVGVPRLFTRPLRLTPSEGLALLAAGRAAQQLPGADAAGPLARALDKLAHAVAAAPNVAVDVQHPPHLEAVQAAVAAGERLRLTYYVASRDELTDRVVDPQLVFLDRGRWYLVADDQAAGGERHFRIDRIEALRRTGEEAVRRPAAPPTEAGWFAGAPDVVAVTLRLPASAAWVTEAFPVDRVETERDGDLVVGLPVASERWLERLLLRAGPQAQRADPRAPRRGGPGRGAAPAGPLPLVSGYRSRAAAGCTRRSARASWSPMPASARRWGRARAVASASARASWGRPRATP